MDVRVELKQFKARLDVEIAAYFDRVIAETKKHDAFMTEALRQVKQLTLAGGKRLRAAFLHAGYIAGGGADRERILKTAVSIELVHIFLLIHDDIIDRDLLRHGEMTIHEHFRRLGEQFAFRSDTTHFGNSMAIIVGDMVGALGNQIIFESGFPPERVLRALSKLQEIVSFTVVGEAKDILMEYRGTATEEEILSMYEHKTARYTVDGPLQLGLTLSGGTDVLANALSAYAVPIGIAFQIQDDILGVFGSESSLGKPVGSDIEEGKMTILVSKALTLASKKESAELLSLLKKGSTLTPENIDRFREILKTSGALDAAKQLANHSIESGTKALSSVDFPSEAKDFLLNVAEYMVKREW